MDFIKALREVNTISKSESSNFRLLKRLSVGHNIYLSIQASGTHYSIPREVLDLDYYGDMELAIFKGNAFTSASDVLENEELIEKLENYYDGTVFGYVPVELIEELYQELSNKVK